LTPSGALLISAVLGLAGTLLMSGIVSEGFFSWPGACSVWPGFPFAGAVLLAFSLPNSQEQPARVTTIINAHTPRLFFITPFRVCNMSALWKPINALQPIGIGPSMQ
jgi:hypothetical protein